MSNACILELFLPSVRRKTPAVERHHRCLAHHGIRRKRSSSLGAFGAWQCENFHCRAAYLVECASKII
jgi:hypothetical protein